MFVSQPGAELQSPNPDAHAVILHVLASHAVVALGTEQPLSHLPQCRASVDVFTQDEPHSCGAASLHMDAQRGTPPSARHSGAAALQELPHIPQ